MFNSAKRQDGPTNEGEDVTSKWDEVEWKRPEKFLKPGVKPVVRSTRVRSSAPVWPFPVGAGSLRRPLAAGRPLASGTRGVRAHVLCRSRSEGRLSPAAFWTHQRCWTAVSSPVFGSTATAATQGSMHCTAWERYKGAVIA